MNLLFLNEMSDNDLRDEIIDYQRKLLEKQDRHALLHAVIQYRIQSVHTRLIEESQIECKGEHDITGFFGSTQ